jgi:hypothetical protein
MALAGADFICKNADCKYCNTDFVMTSIWPLGDIDLVMKAAKGNEEYIRGMMNLKKEGRKYTCIKMPNHEDIPIVGYRIQKWCDFCRALRLFDAIKTSTKQSFEETIKEANIPDFCFTCNKRLKTFSEVTDSKGVGINCPSCNTKLTVIRWFANEREE